MTCHVRHIFTQGDQTKQKIFPSRNQFVNCNISIPSNSNGLLQYNNQELIVTTINPIWRSRPVHPGTKILTFVALRARKTSSLHTIILRKTQTNQATCCLDFQSSIFSLLLGLDTLFQSQSILTLIVQTTVSVVLETSSKQPNKEPLKVSLVHFLLD